MTTEHDCRDERCTVCGPRIRATPTPAAMLGEAAHLLARAERLLCDAGQRDWAGAVGHVLLTVRRRLIPDAQREAEAREWRPIYVFRCEHFPTGSETGCVTCTPTCWQCEGRLGFGPHRCLTCAAKRAEDRARDPSPGVG